MATISSRRAAGSPSACATEVEVRKRALKILTYDDVLLRLATPSAIRRGIGARARLRDRFDVVLVDEFQDTDPVQWDIMSTAFDAEGKTLVLIGDPKQAIYAFRGADVHTYLKAKATVQSKWTLDVNWRSDKGLLAAYDALFRGARLGQAGITYRNVGAAPANSGASAAPRPRVHADASEGASHSGPIRAHLPAEGVPRRRGRATSSPATWQPDGRVPRCRTGDHGSLPTTGTKKSATLHPGDIAVLVRSNRQATTCATRFLRRTYLRSSGSRSVFGSGPAREWLRFLEALERPTARAPGVAGGHDAVHRMDGGAGGRGDVGALGGPPRVAAPLGPLLRDRGVATLYESVTTAPRVPGSSVAASRGTLHDGPASCRPVTARCGRHRGCWPDGPRQLAGAAHPGGRPGQRERRADSAPGVGRRSGAGHHGPPKQGIGVPGRDVPVRLGRLGVSIDVPVFHDPRPRERADHRCRVSGPRLDGPQEIQEAEEQGESLRLLYVALTRARHQAVLLVGWSKGHEELLARRGFSSTGARRPGPRNGARRAPDETVVSTFAGAGTAGRRWSASRGRPNIRWYHHLGSPPSSRSAPFDRELDTTGGAPRTRASPAQRTSNRPSRASRRTG